MATALESMNMNFFSELSISGVLVIRSNFQGEVVHAFCNLYPEVDFIDNLQNWESYSENLAKLFEIRISGLAFVLHSDAAGFRKTLGVASLL